MLKILNTLGKLKYTTVFVYGVIIFTLVIFPLGNLSSGDYSLSNSKSEAEACGGSCNDYCELTLTKSDFGYDPVEPGGEIVYYLTLENTGTADCTGGGVRLRDYFDESTSYVSHELGGNYPSNEDFKIKDEYLQWNFATMHPGDLREVWLTMKVDDDAACNSILVNKAKYYSNETGWSNYLSEETVINCQSAPECGDGILEDGEQCDDGNLVNGDGCDSSCNLESQCNEFVTLNFDEYPAGTIITNQYSGLGATFSVLNNNGPDLGIIFDTANPTGGDGDLVTPGYHPTNTNAQNKVLVIAENDIDNNPADGLIDVPDDESSGGVVHVSFSDPLEIASVALLDIEEQGGTIKVFDENNVQVGDIAINASGDNSWQSVSINKIDIKSMDISLVGSGAITEIKYCKPNVVQPVCGDGILDSGEQCDDGNLVNGDGCSDQCLIEGSIKVCKIIIDEDENIVDGSDVAGTSMVINGTMGNSSFITPLNLNTDLIGSDGINDAECIKFDNLNLGSYEYQEEIINSQPDYIWDSPKYNDQYNSPVINLNDFYEWHENDNSDGEIDLTENRPNRTLIVLNKYSLPASGECQLILTKIGSPSSVYPGDSLDYNLTIKNIGTADCTGTGVKIRDYFDENTEAISANPSPTVSQNDYWEWNLGVISPGEEKVIDITTNVDNDVPCDSIILNKAKYWSNETGWSDFVEEETSLMCSQVGSISGCKYNDANNNSVIDAGEEKISDWEITITYPDQSQVTTNTDENGCYIFDSLPLGTYIVSEENRSGWTQTYPAGEGTYTVELNAPQTITNKDFANYQEPAPHCGDGNLDPGEECDYGADNGNSCTPDYGSSCQYCSDSCTIITLQGPYCGDGNLDPGEECDLGSDNGGDQCTDECTIPESKVDLALNKEVDSSAVEVGQSVVFTITLENEGNLDATGVVVEDRMENGLSYVSHTVSKGYYSSDYGTWTVGDMAVGESATLAIVAQVNKEGTMTNVAEVMEQNEDDYDSEPGNGVLTEDDQDSASVTATTPNVCTENCGGGGGGSPTMPKLVIVKSAAVAWTNPDTIVDYTISITNTGTALGKDLTLEDSLPSGLEYVSSTVTGKWDLGNIDINQTKTVEYQVRFSEGLSAGDYTNTAVAKISNGNSAQDDATVEVRVPSVLGYQLTLAIDKTVDRTFTNPGSEAVYTVTVSNINADTVAKNVILVDRLPDKFTFAEDGLTVKSWVLGDLQPGESKTISYPIKVDSNAQNGIYDNIATVYADNAPEVSDVEPLEVRQVVVEGYSLPDTNGSTNFLLTLAAGLLLMLLGYLLHKYKQLQLLDI